MEADEVGSLAVTSMGQVWHWGRLAGSQDPMAPAPIPGISYAFHASVGWKFVEAVIEIPLVIG